MAESAQSGVDIAWETEYDPSFAVKWILPDNISYPSYELEFYSKSHDITLICDPEESVSAHTRVLIECSEYFKRMLLEPVQHQEKRSRKELDPPQEKQPQKDEGRVIQFPFLSFAALKEAVEFMMTGVAYIPQSVLSYLGEAFIVLLIQPPESLKVLKTDYKLSVSYAEWEDLKEVKLSRETCDITLICDEKTVSAHRAVVSAGSRIFAKKMEEAGDGNTIEIEGITFDILQMIWQLWYKEETVLKPNQLILLCNALLSLNIRALKVIYPKDSQEKSREAQEAQQRAADDKRLNKFLPRAFASANTMVDKLFQAAFSLSLLEKYLNEQKTKMTARAQARATAMEGTLTTLSSSLQKTAELLRGGITGITSSPKAEEKATTLLGFLSDAATLITDSIDLLGKAILSASGKESITSEQSEGSSEAGSSSEHIEPEIELAQIDALAILTALVLAGSHTEVEVDALDHALVQSRVPAGEIQKNIPNLKANMKQIVSQYGPSTIREILYPHPKKEKDSDTEEEEEMDSDTGEEKMET